MTDMPVGRQVSTPLQGVEEQILVLRRFLQTVSAHQQFVIRRDGYMQYEVAVSDRQGLLMAGQGNSLNAAVDDYLDASRAYRNSQGATLDAHRGNIARLKAAEARGGWIEHAGGPGWLLPDDALVLRYVPGEEIPTEPSPAGKYDWSLPCFYRVIGA